MVRGKSLTDFTNLFSPHDFRKNDKKFWTIFWTEIQKANEVQVYGAKQIYVQLDNTLQSRHSRINETEFILRQKSMREKKWLKYLMNILQ